MYFFLEGRQDILLKQEFLHLEQWFKTFLNSLPLQMQDEPHPSHKIGRFFIGHIGWYEFTNVGTSKTFTIDKNLCKEITRATSGTMELCIRTYQGSTQIGSDVYKNLTVYVPEDVVPTVFPAGTSVCKDNR